MKKIMVALTVALFVLLFGSNETEAAEYEMKGALYNNGVNGFGAELVTLSDDIIPFFIVPNGADLESNVSMSLCVLVINADSSYDVKYSGTYSFTSYFSVCNRLGYDGSKWKTNNYLAENSLSVKTPLEGITGNIPVLYYTNSNETVYDALINRNTELVVNPEVLEVPMPDFTNENIIQDGTIPHLYNLRSYDTHYWKTVGGKNQQEGNKELNEKYGNGYLVEWDIHDVSTGSLTPDSMGPVTQDDTLYTKVQVMIDFSWHLEHYFKDDEDATFEGIELYDTFEEMPYFYGMEQHFSDEMLDAKMMKVLKGKFDAEKYTTSGIRTIEYMYFRTIYYDSKEKKYYVSPNWSKVYIGNYGEGSDIEQGSFDSNGNWLPDNNGMSYHVDDKGNIESGKNLVADMLTDEDKNTMLDYQGNNIGWSWDNIRSVASFFGDLPALLGSMFSFVPSVVWWAFAGVLLCIVAMRILGR